MAAKRLLLLLALTLLVLSATTVGVSAQTSTPGDETQVKVTISGPENGDSAGLSGTGWLVDLRLDFNATLDQTGFNGFALTGPGGHTDIAPFAAGFAPGKAGKMPGLVVLISTSSVGAGQGQNLAGLFNLTGVTDLDSSVPTSQLRDTWIITQPAFGVDTPSTVLAAVVADLDGNGMFDDAPNVVVDANGDGVIDEADLTAIGLASNIAKADFFINP
ncbi:MAG TPA: hypothetical protein VHS06_10870 [Chloroflexota bacterium]|nr:hypothetical protein [Chloroflexota bacterium]